MSTPLQSSHSVTQQSVDTRGHRDVTSVAWYRPETKAGMKPEPACLLFLLPWRRQPSPTGQRKRSTIPQGTGAQRLRPLEDSRHLSAPICHCALKMTLDKTNRRFTNRLTEFLYPPPACNRTRFRVCFCRHRCLCHRQVQEQVEQVAPRMLGRLLPHSSLPSWGSGLAADLLLHAGSTLKRFGCLSTCSLLTRPHITVRIKVF